MRAHSILALTTATALLWPGITWAVDPNEPFPGSDDIVWNVETDTGLVAARLVPIGADEVAAAHARGLRVVKVSRSGDGGATEQFFTVVIDEGRISSMDIDIPIEDLQRAVRQGRRSSENNGASSRPQAAGKDDGGSRGSSGSATSKDSGGKTQ